MVEDVEEPFHAELIHVVHFVEFSDGKVEICGSHSNRSVHQTSFLEELVCIVDFLEFFGHCFSTNLAFFENFYQFVCLEKNVWIRCG